MRAHGLAHAFLLGVMAAQVGCAHAHAQDHHRRRHVESTRPRPEPEPTVADDDTARVLPEGPAAGEDCAAFLVAHDVPFTALRADEAPGVDEPVLVTGPIGGVTYSPKSRQRTPSIMACRLAVTLLQVAPLLREAGVHAIEHYSAFRPGARVRGTGRPSGHSRGLALDSAIYHFDDGATLDVLTTWGDRTRGAPPCDPSVTHEEDDSARRLRAVVCGLVDTGLFRVVITPHHDAAHQNHVHLEVVPEVTWTYVH